jgi:hypothetical protein
VKREREREREREIICVCDSNNESRDRIKVERDLAYEGQKFKFSLLVRNVLSNKTPGYQQWKIRCWFYVNKLFPFLFLTPCFHRFDSLIAFSLSPSRFLFLRYEPCPSSYLSLSLSFTLLFKCTILNFPFPLTFLISIERLKSLAK